MQSPPLERLRRVAASALIAAVLVQAAPRDAGAEESRIVSIGGAVTEILYALGEENRIVGVDSTSLYPPQAANEKTSVGYMRQLSAEGVLGLRPSLILAIEGSGPKDTLGVLEAAKVPMIVVPDRFSEAGILEKIHVVAGAVGAPARGECLARQVAADLDALTQFKAAIGTKKRVLFVLSFVNGRALAAGRGTAADGIIRMAGAVNAIDGFDGYKAINDEAVIAARPDVVLAMRRGGPEDMTADKVFAQPAFAATPAGAKRSFVSMDGLYLLGFGPRTARAARDLAAAIYPDLKSTPLPSERGPSTTRACAQ
ncbi:MAG TPA: hemin ABC transporter substrate-binding protein [Pseudolabrys sp.]|nr:hemin ABC transporter substrate-binding protein [Pseudolabrys sp.]